jgi:hypothetical protein
LLCWVLKVAAPATIATIYSKKKDSMTIPLSVYMWHKKTETTALLDSGAMHNFIDKQAVTSLGLGTCSLPHPLQVNNVDGSINSEGSITRPVHLVPFQLGVVTNEEHGVSLGLKLALALHLDISLAPPHV